MQNFTNLEFADSVKKALTYAKDIALKMGSLQISSEHLLYGLTCVNTSLASKLLKEEKVTKEKLLEFFSDQFSPINIFSNQLELTPRSKHIILTAQSIASQIGHSFVSAEHVLLAMLYSEECYASRILTEGFDIDIVDLRDKLFSELNKDLSVDGEKGTKPQEAEPEKSTLPEKLLEMGSDVTLKARQGKIDPIIGREPEIERIIEILCRKTKNNPILIGEAGVGKTAVIEGLAQAMVKGRVPQVLKDKIIYSLDIGSLMAGTKFRGELEQKLKDAIETIITDKRIIVFIDEIHTLAQAGSEKGDVSPADMLKPYLSRGELQTIGATTTDEYRKFIEKDKALERRFQPIMVNPPTVDQTIEILRGLKDSYEAFHKVTIKDDAIIAAATLSDRYIMDRNLPDKAIDLIDEASSRAKVSGSIIPESLQIKQNKFQELEKNRQEAVLQYNYEKAGQIHAEIVKLVAEMEEERKKLKLSKPEDNAWIGEDQIAEVVAKWTGIPVTKITETERDRLLRLEDILHKRVIGQEEAVEAVAKAIRRSRVGLQDSKRPIGSFLFLGQTGVGKTELCKAIAEAMFDNENMIIRLDMSEYMEQHSVAKLIGSPPGYVGYGDGGQLTEQVRRKPYSVVLFDEIEKAHPEVFNMLLQMLDDGRLTDSQGRVVNFKNTIIVMTSNVGVSELSAKNSLGFSTTGFVTGNPDYEQMKEVILNSVKKKFKPEFLNRIDVMTVFHSLSSAQLTKIAMIMINNLNKRLKEKGISIKITEAALNYLVEKGASPEYGARPLKRMIQQEVEDRLAEELLSEGLKEGNVVIDINTAGNGLAFNKK